MNSQQRSLHCFYSVAGCWSTPGTTKGAGSAFLSKKIHMIDYLKGVLVFNSIMWVSFCLFVNSTVYFNTPDFDFRDRSVNF